MELSIRRYTEDQVDELLRIRNAVFQPHVSSEYLLAKYSEEALQHRNVCTVGYVGDEMVAFYGAIPYEAKYRGETIWIGHGCDSITMPAYQGKGVHKQLAKASFELMKEDGFAFMFAMNSAQTAQATEKLGMMNLGAMARFHMSTGSVGFNRALEKVSWTERRYQRFVSGVLGRISVPRTEFVNSLNRYDLSILYNDRFMEYKSYAPNYVVQLGQCIVWVKAVGVLSVGAILGMTEHNVENVLNSLHALARKLLVKEVMFHISKNTLEAELLSKQLTMKESWTVTCLPFNDSVDPSGLRLNYADFDTF